MVRGRVPQYTRLSVHAELRLLHIFVGSLHVLPEHQHLRRRMPRGLLESGFWVHCLMFAILLTCSKPLSSLSLSHDSAVQSAERFSREMSLWRGEDHQCCCVRDHGDQVDTRSRENLCLSRELHCSLSTTSKVISSSSFSLVCTFSDGSDQWNSRRESGSTGFCWSFVTALQLQWRVE